MAPTLIVEAAPVAALCNWHTCPRVCLTPSCVICGGFGRVDRYRARARPDLTTQPLDRCRDTVRYKLKKMMGLHSIHFASVCALGGKSSVPTEV
jgi:hypothetical protein